MLRAFSAIGLLIVGIWGVYHGAIEYIDSKNVSRVLESIHLHRQFVGNNSDSKSYRNLQVSLVNFVGNQTDTIICEYIKNNELKKKDQKSSCEANDFEKFNFHMKDNSKSKDFQKFYSMKISDELEIKNHNIHALLGHYIALIKCVDNNGCDGVTAFDIYRDDMIIFVNAFCQFFQNDSQLWNSNIAADRVIVNFLQFHSENKIYPVPVSNGCHVEYSQKSELAPTRN